LTKKTTIILILAIVISIAIAFFSLYLKKGDANILYKVPIDAKSVLVIDVPALSKKLFIDDLGKKNKSRAALLKSLPDSLANLDFKNCGLDISNKLALFTFDDTLTSSVSIYFVLQINDNKDFTRFVDTLCLKLSTSAQKSGIIQYSNFKSFGLLLAWNKEYVAGSISVRNTNEELKILEKILSIKKDQSIMMDANFKEKLNKNYDVLVYSKPYQSCTIKGFELINSNIETLFSFFKFNDGELEIATELKTKPGGLLDKLCKRKDKYFNILENTDSSLVKILLNVDPEAFNHILNQYSSIHFKESKIPILKSWNGKASLVINGIKNIETGFVTYDYDDNFNKIETKKTKQNKILELQSVVGTNQNQFDSIMKNDKPEKEGKDTFLFAGSNYLLKKVANNFLIYSKQTEKPAITNQTTNENIFIEVNYLKFLLLIKEFGIKTEKEWFAKVPLSKFKVIINKDENIHINGNFYFKNKDKNALFSLFEGFESNK
jgi:hypothetical protein